jgi:hypothetical protein
MHTVELLEEATSLAAELGFKIRQEWFGGCAAGACEIKGQKWIFIDLALSPREQLEQVLAALREMAVLPDLSASGPLQSLLQPRRAA